MNIEDFVKLNKEREKRGEKLFANPTKFFRRHIKNAGSENSG